MDLVDQSNQTNINAHLKVIITYLIAGISLFSALLAWWATDIVPAAFSRAGVQAVLNAETTQTINNIPDSQVQRFVGAPSTKAAQVNLPIEEEITVQIGNTTLAQTEPGDLRIGSPGFSAAVDWNGLAPLNIRIDADGDGVFEETAGWTTPFPKRRWLARHRVTS